MMATVAAIPPFETFYAEHAGEVLQLLRSRLGRERADDERVVAGQKQCSQPRGPAGEQVQVDALVE